MKSKVIVQIEPFMVRPEIAGALLGTPHLVQDMVKAGWIKPCYKVSRCTLYLVRDLKECAERLARGERPTT